MRKFLGLMLLCSGLGFAAYAHYPSSIDREQKLATVTRIIAESQATGPTSMVAAGQPGYRQPLPAYAPVAPVPQTGQTGQSVIAKSTAGSAVADAPRPAGPPVAPPVAGATTSVVLDWRALVATGPAPSLQAFGPATTSALTGASTRRELAQDLQRELKRVGCYNGAVDGTWRGSSRRAMARFVDRVNASLPVAEPDVILLTLIRGHRDGACGAGCPGGQVMSGGRCTPKAVIAQAERANVPRPAKLVGTPKPQALALLEPTKPVAGRHAEKPATTATEPPVANSQPLPGRMSVGGPTPSTEQSAGLAPPVAVEVLPWQRPANAMTHSIAPPNPAPGQPTTANSTDGFRTAALDTGPASEHLARTEAGAAAAEAPSSLEKRAKLEITEKRRSPSVTVTQSPRRTYRARRVYSAYRFTPPPRPAQRRRYATRGVQALFIHPLGRL